ncbi:MAG: hypothetical protein IJW59_00175 [Clostridia bacterium]|nr:hypothetical protein [Clostridia bacterium]
MKKILSFVFAVCLLVPALALVACGAKVPGTYNVTSVVTTLNGSETTITKSEYNELKEKNALDRTAGETLKVAVGKLVFDVVKWTFNEDNTFTYYQAEGDAGTWALDGDLLRVTYKGTEDTQDFEFKKGKISYTVTIGGYKMSLTLEKSK